MVQTLNLKYKVHFAATYAIGVTYGSNISLHAFGYMLAVKHLNKMFNKLTSF
jgi:hypothetical protein